MPNDKSNPQPAPLTADEIRAQLQADRDALGADLSALAERMRPAALARSAGRAVKHRVVDAAQAVAAPFTTPFTGSKGEAASEELAPSVAAAAAATSVLASIRSALSEKGPATSDAIPADATDDAPPREPWLDHAIALRARAAEMLRGIERAARENLAPAADLARHKAEILAAEAGDLRDTLASGLGHLAAEARDAAIAAREALLAEEGSALAAARRVVHDRPLMSGAAMVAAGAVLAAVLPQGERERGYVRSTRDLAADRVRHFAIDEALTLASALVATAIAGMGAAKVAEAATDSAPDAPPDLPQTQGAAAQPENREGTAAA